MNSVFCNPKTWLGILGTAGLVLACSGEQKETLSDIPSVGDTGTLVAPPQAAQDVTEGGSETIVSQVFYAEGEPCTPPTSQVVINEIMIDPNKVSDAYGEWFEVHNPGSTQINLQGWKIRSKGQADHTIVSSVVVPPGGYVVICRNSDPNLNGGVTNCAYGWSQQGGGISLANTTPDTLELLNPQGEIVDSVAWDASSSRHAPVGRSIALRHPFLDNSSIVFPSNPDNPASWANLNFGASTNQWGDNTDYGTPGTRNIDVWQVIEHEACNDNEICTYDLCEAGACHYEWKQNCCHSNADCNDNNICTQDVCDQQTNTCSHMQIEGCCTQNSDCVDENPCNYDYCLNNTCRHSTYNVVPGCCWAPDVDPATGQPWNPPEKKQQYADSQCDDKNPCTPDYCDLQTNQCKAGPPTQGCCTTAADCDDQNPCTWEDCFQYQCRRTQLYNCCVQDSDCNDNDPCTTDRCIMNACRHLFDSTTCCVSDAWCATNADDHNPCTDEKCLYDPQVGIRTCQHVYKSFCSVQCPYEQNFNTASDFQEIGWKVYDFGTNAKSNWHVTETGSLGPDKHVLFTWNPTTVLVKSVNVTPFVDCSNAALDQYNPLKTATLQWRMAYKHYQQGQQVTLKVVGTDSGDFQGGTVLWQTTTDKDIEYDLYSVQLPSHLKFSNLLQVGFMIETNSTIYLDSWQIDDVRIAAGVPNEVMKVKLYYCRSDNCRIAPGSTESTFVSESVGGFPDLTIALGEKYRYLICYKDRDAMDMAWNFYGYPEVYLESAPLDYPPFITPVPLSGTSPCQTLRTIAQTLCGDPDAMFICMMDVKPGDDQSVAGVYRVAFATYDEHDPVKPKHSPFESLEKATINVLLPRGYLVWSPLGPTEPSAQAILQAIRANGRPAQIITSLDVVQDLSQYDGIFATLGIYGRYHTLTAHEAEILKDFLDRRGRLYLEGGEFFYTGNMQPETVLHPYFKVTAVSDGQVKIDGPLAGRNFLDTYTFGYSQSPLYNAWNDKIAHTPGEGGREVLKNNGQNKFTVAVTYDSGTYRTIASSILFGGVQSGGSTPLQLMAKYLYFLENGYPPCSADAQCEDDEVCTVDSCSNNVCSNAQIPNCVPCSDDRQCQEDQACNVAKGYCVDILCDNGVCPVKKTEDAGQLPQNFGKNPQIAYANITVTQPGLVNDIQLKAKVFHYFRGDVKLTLQHPDGTQVVLKREDLSDSAQHIYATYDIGVPVASGENLDNLRGKPLAGVWKLIAEDTRPLYYNGQLQGATLYASFEAPQCQTAQDCPDDQNACTTADCQNNVCVWIPKDCDDGDSCTLDSCDPQTGECKHQPVPGAGCGCARHSDCPEDEVCLDDNTGAVCDPLTGPPDCHCNPICDPNIYGADCLKFKVQSGLPVAIPDANPSGVSKTLAITGQNGVVRKLWVKVVTKHTAIGDLTSRLCNGQTCATLHYLEGGNEDGFYKVFDYDPSHGPGDTTSFKGFKINGNWTLTVADLIGGDTGTLENYTLYMVKTGCYRKEDCDDNNPCTIDSCEVNGDVGVCKHTQITCQPTNNPCTVRECNPQNGLCELKTLPNGTSCEDGLYCTEEDTCQNGQCTGGPAKDCSYLDGNCIKGVCDEQLDSCVPQVLRNGEPCDAGDPCLIGDYCDANGVCQQGSTPACHCTTDADCVDDGDKCNGILGKCNLQTGFCELVAPPVDCNATMPPLPECQYYECWPVDGTCKVRTRPNFYACEDGLFCTVQDYCLNGSCTAGIARDCSYLDDKCVLGVCDENQDKCVAQGKPAGTDCEREGNGCTIDKCDGNGNCVFFANVDCSGYGDECNPAICQPRGWGSYECVRDPLPDGRPCSDDGNPCTSDTCQQGVCTHTKLAHCQTCGNNANEPCPCGGQHAFDAGDNTCGYEDSCVGGINGAGEGRCYPTCGDPQNPVLPGQCIEAHSGIIDKPITEKNTPDTPGGCTMHKLTVSSNLPYVSSVLLKAEVVHSFIGDLTVELIDPQGYAHLVWNRIGWSSDNFYNTFDYSFPVPYPQIITSGVPMCSLRGEQLSGDWYIRICDHADGNSGYLHQWALYFRGSSDPNLNPGHRCEDAIDIGVIDINPPQPFSGSTACSVNIIPMSGCGASPGPDRVYKFTLTQPKRVTVTVPQPQRDLVVYIKKEAQGGGTCDPGPGSIACSNSYGAGGPPEVVDVQILQPGTYYLGIDTVGTPFDYGPFQFTIRIRSLIEDGGACVDPILGPQDLDCFSGHCRNGYCCAPGPNGTNDCCPGDEWPVPPDGENPELIKSDPRWISANAVCPAQYKDLPVCHDSYPDPENPGNNRNDCQGHRYDANCVNHVCTKTYVNDDSACDSSVESNVCGYYLSVFCEDYGPYPPWAQLPPPCPTTCLQADSSCTKDADCPPSTKCVSGKCENDSLCDPNAHCDKDPNNPNNSICLPDLPDGSQCDENSDCVSGHCQNGFCCQQGDCCPSNDTTGALFCPASYTVPPSCNQSTTCDGERKDPVCVNYMCGSVVVQDDCACAGLVAFNCGLYVPQKCPSPPGNQCPYPPFPVAGPGQNVWESPKPQCPDTCNQHGQGPEDDSLCLDVATCDRCVVVNSYCTAQDVAEGNAVCQAKLPYGYPCDEDTDCINYSDISLPGHCQNGYCCLTGDCCAINLGGGCDPQQFPHGCPNPDVCPTKNPPSGYWQPPTCDNQRTCQGHRMDAVCNANFTCGTQSVDDDSGCTAQMVADECTWYKSVYCNGQVNQTPPQCPTTCTSNNDCDPNAKCDPLPPSGCDEWACAPNEALGQAQCNYPDGEWLCKFDRENHPPAPDGGTMTCQPKYPNDWACNEASDCISGYCQLHFCCDVGGCCRGCKVTGWVPGFGSAGSDEGGLSTCDPNNPNTPCRLQTITGQASPAGRATGSQNIVDFGFMPTGVPRYNGPSDSPTGGPVP